MSKFIRLDDGRLIEREGATTGGAGAENELVALDNSGHLDSSLLPPGVGEDLLVAQAGEALTAGDFVAIDGSGAVVRAVASQGGRDALGFVLDGATTGETVPVYLSGQNWGLSELSPGARHYLSDVTPGAATTTAVTASGSRHQFLGIALNATTIAFANYSSIKLI